MAKRSVHDFSKSDLKKAALHAITVGAEPGAGQSTQPEDDLWTPSDALTPPVSLDALADLTLTTPLRRSAIAAIVLNTVGRGFKLAPREGFEDQAPAGDEGDPAHVARELDAMARRDRRLGRPNFTKLLSASRWDTKEVGSGYIEVSRNRSTGRIDGFYRAEGKRVRRAADRKGWVIGPKGGRGLELVRYYDFGDKVVYDDNGRPTPKLADGATRWDRNELIPMQEFTSASRDYGLPPDAQLAVDYAGDKFAARTNLNYFDSNAVPPTVLFITGTVEDTAGGSVEVEIPPELVQQIVNVVRGAGAVNSRVAVIPVPPGAQITREDLAVISERDVGFIAYRADNRRRMLGAWRISPIFVADIEDTNYSTATIERRLTKEQVFDPEQAEVSDLLTETILRELAPHLAFEFEDLDIVDDEERRQSANDAADRGKITNGEYRAAHGYPPLPEADRDAEPDIEKGEVEFGWNNALVESGNVGAALAPVAEPVPPDPTPQELADMPPEQLAKALTEKRLRELGNDLEDDFTAAVAEGVRTVTAMTDDAELRPVVIEKIDGEVFIRPYSMNGAG